jgi:hypothetical protein
MPGYKLLLTWRLLRAATLVTKALNDVPDYLHAGQMRKPKSGKHDKKTDTN